ncbi:hypothetical protein BB560_004514 [Smittium megazygosporum]|uniref:Hexosyltransferase n=1 Tax=Smittium megazygosporum TaxID=133381 RepID=A0A2T9Z910_9FUNG|nr:hypothetical protein BB560_004514 [Smittium megazygosporum]
MQRIPFSKSKVLIVVFIIFVCYINIRAFIYLEEYAKVIRNIYDDEKAEINRGLGSWKIPKESIMSIVVPDSRIQRGFQIKLPKKTEGNNGKVYELYNDYIILVPMSKYEDVDFFKNFLHNDLNIFIVCDKDDFRAGCDANLDSNYSYTTLREKTHDMFSKYCMLGRTHNMVAKMDFDAIINKDYLFGLTKFISDNKEKRIYYGNPFFRKNGVAMGGNFYALSKQLMKDFCSCEHSRSSGALAEDLWFGETLNNCIIQKNFSGTDAILHLFNNQDKILHKVYSSNGVSLSLGRQALKS